MKKNKILIGLSFLVLIALLAFRQFTPTNYPDVDTFKASRDFMVFDADDIKESAIYNGEPTRNKPSDSLHTLLFNKDPRFINCVLVNSDSNQNLGVITKSTVQNEITTNATYYVNDLVSEKQAVDYLLSCVK